MDNEPHTWIGVLFSILEDGRACMQLPKPFLEEFDSLLIPLMKGTGTIPLKTAQRIVGNVGRLSQVVKEARPFTNALYTAHSASAHADRIGPREAGPGLAPCSRFATVARCVHRLISGK